MEYCTKNRKKFGYFFIEKHLTKKCGVWYNGNFGVNARIDASVKIKIRGNRPLILWLL